MSQETRQEIQRTRYKAKITKFRWNVAHNGIDNEIQVSSVSQPGTSKFIRFLWLIGKLSSFEWLTTVVLMKVDLIVDEKKKLQ